MVPPALLGGPPIWREIFPFTAQAVDSTGTPAGTSTGNCGMSIGAELTSTTLTVAPNPALLGQPVTLTAQISPPPGVGRVTFYNGATVLGSAAVVGGSASLTTSLQTAASHTLRAWYDGNPSYTGSASTAATLTSMLSPVALSARRSLSGEWPRHLWRR